METKNAMDVTKFVTKTCAEITAAYKIGNVSAAAGVYYACRDTSAFKDLIVDTLVAEKAIPLFALERIFRTRLIF